jgi:hypothetical protein
MLRELTANEEVCLINLYVHKKFLYETLNVTLGLQKVFCIPILVLVRQDNPHGKVKN